MSDLAQRPSSATNSTARLTRGRLVLVFCLALGLLLAIAAYAYDESRREAQARTMVTHTLLVLKQAQELEIAAIVMEADQRAYLISGQTEALAGRDVSHDQAVRLVGELVALVGNNPSQVRRARQSAAALDRRYRVMQETAALAASAGLPAARARFQALGDRSIEPMRKLLEAVHQEERRLVVVQAQIADRRLARFHLLLVSGTSLAFAILIVTGLALLRELTRAERISMELAEASSLQQALNRELSSQADELLQSNRELESFSYSVSHDLRAPLRHINGYARMLSEDAADQLQPESRRYLQTIIDSARRMGLLIDDLLAFSRLGRKPLARQHVNMQDLVESAVGEIRTSNNSAVHIDIATLPSVDGDPALLRQVWANLLSNAYKYSAPRGDQARIVVAGERKGDQMHYWVGDNGVGFDMRYADKLFGVFQRLHPQDQFEGTGVGLAIVQRIISRHGGKISATAEEGRGACFTFELPIGEAVA